jgi:4-hydroxyphenylpyruvate dioxygenase
MSIEIQSLLGFRYYVRDLERIRRFYLERMGFNGGGPGSPLLADPEHHAALEFHAGRTVITCCAPLREDGPAARYLARHPEGVGELVFEVRDARRAFARLEANGATPIDDVRSHIDGARPARSFVITTPFGDTNFRFVERAGPRELTQTQPGYTDVDHVTFNLRTMKPALLWLEHVMELEPFWNVEFHTAGGEASADGSGLRSQVMWDPASGLKLACNEPLRPAFFASQVSTFCDDNGGDGVQHVALAVREIGQAVRALRGRGGELVPPPPGYHERLGEHLRRLGLEKIDEDHEQLRELGLLVDGSSCDAYLLQVFLREAAATFDSPQAGGFFFELIERKGDAGFGAGNFRALFDSVAAERALRVG